MRGHYAVQCAGVWRGFDGSCGCSGRRVSRETWDNTGWYTFRAAFVRGRGEPTCQSRNIQLDGGPFRRFGGEGLSRGLRRDDIRWRAGRSRGRWSVDLEGFNLYNIVLRVIGYGCLLV